MEYPKTSIASTLDPGFRVRPAIHQNRSRRDTVREIETTAARFMGIAGFVATSFATGTGTIIVAVERIRVSIYRVESIAIMLVRRNAVGIGGIIHTSLLARTVFAGVTEPEEMTDLLAHNVPLLIRILPVRRPAVIHFR